jgi:hypothetical protein
MPMRIGPLMSANENCTLQMPMNIELWVKAVSLLLEDL